MSKLDGRLELETIDYNQVGWDAIHNSNMQKINTFVNNLAAQDPVIDKDLDTPPSSPEIGDRYIVKSTGAQGDWSGKENNIAEWNNGIEWYFIEPFPGMHTFVLDEEIYYIFKLSAWYAW